MARVLALPSQPAGVGREPQVRQVSRRGVIHSTQPVLLPHISLTLGGLVGYITLTIYTSALVSRY